VTDIVPTDNPAGRLFALLDAMKRADPNTSVRYFVARESDVEPADVASILEYVAKAVRLSAETRRAMESREDPEAQVYADALDEVETAVATMREIDTPLRQLLAGLTDLGWRSLRACALLLRRRDDAAALDELTIAELSTRFMTLRDDVAAAPDLDTELRTFLLRHLTTVIQRLDEVRFFGTEGLESAFNEATGALARSSGAMDRLRNSSVATGLVTAIVALDLALNVASNAKSLLPAEPDKPSPVVVQIVDRCAPAITAGQQPVK